MSDQFEGNLEKYAQVIVKVGLNLQPGQRLMIGSPFFGIDGTPIEASQLVRHIVKFAYQAGAPYVGVNWDDEELQRIRVEHAPAGSMSEFASWKNDVAIEYIEKQDAFLHFHAQNPDLMKGLDPEKIQLKQQSEAQHFHALFSGMAAGATNWSVATASIKGWATKVFPDIAEQDAVARLWDTIFEACRLGGSDPIAGWESHITELAKRSDYLNHKKFAGLRYRAPGTDLSVGLPGGHIWHSGALTARNGVTFVANIPTEEVFTVPDKGRIEGQVTATKPLSYSGSLIERFSLKFAGGQVVEATAESGQEALDNLLNTDAASRSLGEVALVPNSSPISQSGLLFYNILFDENASNHLALGNAYRFSLEGGEEMTAEEFEAAGGNESVTHADFMIGSGEMDVDGLTGSGAAEPVMRAGEWAFEV
jgi:aminopeptidase